MSSSHLSAREPCSPPPWDSRRLVGLGRWAAPLAWIGSLRARFPVEPEQKLSAQWSPEHAHEDPQASACPQECRAARGGCSHHLPHVTHGGPTRGPERAGAFPGCWKTPFPRGGHRLLLLCPGACYGHSVKVTALPTTLSPSGAMFPNSGSPEAATM